MAYLAELKAYLDGLASKFERPKFILEDPISIPHGFDNPRDQEIIGLYAALLAWGQRKTVLNKMAELCERMNYRPWDFVFNFNAGTEHHLSNFKHRTFQPIDALWFTRNLSALIKQHGTIERAFSVNLKTNDEGVGPAIQGFSNSLISINEQTPARLKKHLARPSAGSACKRLCMYLRWMVRSGPVDLGIWTSISPSQLVLPLDVHAGRQARALGMLERKQNDWKAAHVLTANCKKLNPDDPARYDFAFFGAGAYGENLDPYFSRKVSSLSNTDHS